MAARVLLPPAAAAASTTRRWPLARHFAPGGGGDNVTELCYGAVGAGGPTANAYLPGTGTYDRGGNTPVASGPETKGKTPRPSNKGSGPKHLMTRRAPNTSRTTHERSEGTPEDSGPKHLLTGKPLIKGGGNIPGTFREPLAKGPRQGKSRDPNTYIPGPKHLYTGREHSGNGQEPLGNGGEQGTETTRTNLWIDTGRPTIDSSRRPGSHGFPLFHNNLQNTKK